MTLDFICPRCLKATVAEFYGPCEDCTVDMRTAAGEFLEWGAQRRAEGGWEPKGRG